MTVGCGATRKSPVTRTVGETRRSRNRAPIGFSALIAWNEGEPRLEELAPAKAR